MKIEAKEVLTPGQVARLFGVDAHTVARWRRDGKFRVFRTPGGHTRFYADDILPMVRAYQEGTPGDEEDSSVG